MNAECSFSDSHGNRKVRHDAFRALASRGKEALAVLADPFALLGGTRELERAAGVAGVD